MTMDQRRKRIWAYQGAAIAGGLAIMVLTLLFNPRTGFGLGAITAIAAVAIVWSLVLAWRAFAKMDEFMREGSKFAWYWGGLIGLSASAPVYAFVVLGGLQRLQGVPPLGRQAALSFGVGYALPVVAQLLGFWIALIVWRRRTRQ